MRINLFAFSLSLAALPALAEDSFDTEGGFQAFEQLFGVTEGMRRNHNQGVLRRGCIHPYR